MLLLVIAMTVSVRITAQADEAVSGFLSVEGDYSYKPDRSAGKEEENAFAEGVLACVSKKSIELSVKTTEERRN